MLDNYITHKTDPVGRWLARHPRFHAHFTPTYSSWLNLVERCFGLLTQRCIKRGVHCSTWALEQDIRAFVARNNTEPKPYIWTKTADEILDSVRRFCGRLLDVHRPAHRDETSGTGH